MYDIARGLFEGCCGLCRLCIAGGEDEGVTVTSNILSKFAFDDDSSDKEDDVASDTASERAGRQEY